jgi:hypothetical protein
MVARRIAGRWQRGYTVDEAANFLQYDRDAVAYWLRTGHLNGLLDTRSGEWLVTTRDLIAFIRDSNEPMPTGASGQLGELRLLTSVLES